MNINGSSLEAITYHNSDDYEPIFSPDGQSIVFTSERDENKEIYLFYLLLLIYDRINLCFVEEISEK